MLLVPLYHLLVTVNQHQALVDPAIPSFFMSACNIGVLADLLDGLLTVHG